MSKKLVPAEWISMRYLSAVGVGVGTSVTFRSRGPLGWKLDWGLYGEGGREGGGEGGLL